MHYFYKPLRHLSIALLISIGCCFGCATTQDVSYINKKISDNSSRLEKQGREVKELKQKGSNLDTEMQNTKKRLADMLVQVQNVHERLFTLEADIEDYHQLIEKTRKDSNREIEGLKMRLDRLDELSKSFANEIKAIKELQTIVPVSQTPRSTKAWEDLDEEAFYNLAYQTFQKGNYDAALEIFNAFLDKFPRGRFSDNATFWIGECYYKTNKFEQAIIEYEKVKQNYPSGDKVPPALFKQALSFIKLHKQAEAKIILNQIIEHYPQSDQAAMAKVQLDNLK